MFWTQSYICGYNAQPNSFFFLVLLSKLENQLISFLLEFAEVDGASVERYMPFGRCKLPTGAM